MERLRLRHGVCLAIILFVFASNVAFGATAEHTATLEAFTGEVKILQGGTTSVTPALRMVLRSKDVVYTGKASSATIVFSDGSAIQLEPKTRFIVQLLEYAGGQRRRSFSLNYGTVIARISRFFGAGSKASIATPTAVAAARGTGFRLTYDALTMLTILSVTDGTVEYTCGGVTTLCHAGETIVSRGSSPGKLGNTPPDAGSQFLEDMMNLSMYETPPTITPPSVLENALPPEPTVNPPRQPIEPTPPLTTEPVIIPPTGPPPAPSPPPPFTPTAPPEGQQNSQVQRANWALPGILGAGVLAAVLSGGGGSRGGEPVQPIPEPSVLLAMGLGISGLAAGIRRSRLKVKR
jgi:hypothetical protein